MPRIRTIKPEFWTDEKLSLLDVTTRLVFLALISTADDAGRLVDNIKLLDGQIFPNTGDTCRDALDTLARMGRVIRYRSESGQALIQIARWDAHQKVDKPSKYVLPGPDDAALVQHLADTPLRDEEGERGEGAREIVASVSRESRAPTVDRGPWTNDPGPRTMDRGPQSALDDVASRLPAAADREAYARLITLAPDPDTWRAEMRVVLDGMPGHHHLTPTELGEAIREYVGNGAAKNRNLRQFRRYLEHARPAPERQNGHRPRRGRGDRPHPGFDKIGGDE